MDINNIVVNAFNDELQKIADSYGDKAIDMGHSAVNAISSGVA